MRLEMLVSALNVDPEELPRVMNLETDSVIIHQCDEYSYRETEYDGHLARCYSMTDRGVGLSRNDALMRSRGELILFSDDDIVYDKGYAKRVVEEFDRHPEADMLLFNIRVREDRRTYHNDSYSRVRIYNCGRYPAYSFALRADKVRGRGIMYNTMFGGGCTYSNGEDSLFISDCIRAGLRVFRTPVEIGEEKDRGGSTWFEGYNEKFFFDRGVLYHFLYGKLAYPMSLRFLAAHGGNMCRDIPFKKALGLMREGISHAAAKY